MRICLRAFHTIFQRDNMPYMQPLLKHLCVCVVLPRFALISCAAVFFAAAPRLQLRLALKFQMPICGLDGAHGGAGGMGRWMT